MPWKPKHPCKFPVCAELVDYGQSRCPKHEALLRTQYDDRRGTSTQRGYGVRWRQLRRWWLNAHPLCEECKKQGKLVTAEVVDHIVPHRGNYALLYDPANLQSLCTTCHNRKTAAEDGGLGNVS